MVYQYKKQYMNNDAFTLIEILVVITIFGLLVLVGLSSFNRSIDQIRLQMTVESVASDIRSDQTYIKSGAYETANIVLCKGYKFDVDGLYPVSVNYVNGSCDMTSITEGVELPYNTGVALSSIDMFDSDSNYTGIVILFSPPEAKISFYVEDNDELDLLNTSQVTLTFDYNLSDYSKQRELTINRSGKVQY